jgi:hypothetical protein
VLGKYLRLKFVLFAAIILAIVGLAYLVLSYPSTPAPTFSVILSPANLTVNNRVQYEQVKFNVTITGNPTYPCVVILNGGNLPADTNPKYTIYASGEINGPYGSHTTAYSNETSKTFTISPNIENNRTVSYYVSVEDNLGIIARSNQIQVLYTYE